MNRTLCVHSYAAIEGCVLRCICMCIRVLLFVCAGGLDQYLHVLQQVSKHTGSLIEAGVCEQTVYTVEGVTSWNRWMWGHSDLRFNTPSYLIIRMIGSYISMF